MPMPTQSDVDQQLEIKKATNRKDDVSNQWIEISDKYRRDVNETWPYTRPRPFETETRDQTSETETKPRPKPFAFAISLLSGLQAFVLVGARVHISDFLLPIRSESFHCIVSPWFCWTPITWNVVPRIKTDHCYRTWDSLTPPLGKKDVYKTLVMWGLSDLFVHFFKRFYR